MCRHHHNGRWEARIGRVFGNKYLYLGTYGVLFLPFFFSKETNVITLKIFVLYKKKKINIFYMYIIHI